MLEHEGRSQLLIWNCMKSMNIFGNIIKARNTHSVCKWLNFYEVKLSWKFIHNPWPSTCGVNWNKLFAIVLIFPLSFCKKGQIWESVQFGQDWLMEGRHLGQIWKGMGQWFVRACALSESLMQGLKRRITFTTDWSKWSTYLVPSNRMYCNLYCNFHEIFTCAVDVSN